MPLLKQTCLSPSYSLRKQLLLSFGCSAVLTLVIVATVVCVSVHVARLAVETQAQELLGEQVLDRLQNNTMFIAKAINTYMESIDGSAQLATEFVRDRIVGYPNNGWQEDRYVPFLDMQTNTNRYPLQSALLPLADTDTDTDLSQYYGSYFEQGPCDDIHTGNCTWNRFLYAKSADLAVLFKPIQEATPDAVSVDMYFANSGEGAVVSYPGRSKTWMTSSSNTSASVGCDWMRQTNPNTKRPFATEEDISRCSQSTSNFNPWKTSWYRDIALDATKSKQDQEQVLWRGPYSTSQDSITTSTTMKVGRGVFDRRTGEFIGCVSIELSLSHVSSLLAQSQIHQDTISSLIRYDTGAILVDTLGSTNTNKGTVLVHDSDLPISSQDLQQIKSLVAKAKGPHEKFVISNEAGYLTVYPLPELPSASSSANSSVDYYNPKYLVLEHTAYSSIQDVLEVENQVSHEVQSIMILTILLSLLGVAAVIAIVYIVSRAITRPLLYIERVAWSIIHHNEEEELGLTSEHVRRDTRAGGESQTMTLCAESTEIAQLLSEFRTMIGKFSGEGASKVASSQVYEIPNLLTWRTDYHRILRDASYEFSSFHDEESPVLRLGRSLVESPSEQESDGSMGSSQQSKVVPAPQKKNLGPNVRGQPFGKQGKAIVGQRSTLHSPMFWWILGVMVAPLVLICGGICVYVSNRIVSTFPDWLAVVESESVRLEHLSQEAEIELKRMESEVAITEIVRDLFILTRVAGWLFFNGVQRSESFTHLTTATEECKGYPRGECPFFDDPNRAVCDCDWDDRRAPLNTSSKGVLAQCHSYNEIDSRYLQHRFWHGQARDFDPVTGERNFARAFLEDGLDDSPETTAWFVDAMDTPGAEKGVNASGFSTTYDRLRIASALAVVDVPLYNFATSLGRKKHDLGTHLAFEADGMSTGYTGCQYGQTGASKFQSTDSNRASELAPNLCPLGKFGYDPRCRDWYVKARDKWQQTAVPLHITSPYLFANEGTFGTSVTAPIVNPRTDEYVGQALMDVVPNRLQGAFEASAQHTSFLITPEQDALGGDTVIFGNGQDEGREWQSTKVTDHLFENDPKSSVNRVLFDLDILPEMQAGKQGRREFQRTGSDGLPEALVLNYAPVKARTLTPLRPDDFSYGVNVSEILVYSIGILHSADAIRQPWAIIEDDVTHQLERIRNGCVSLCVVIIAFFLLFAVMVTVRVTRPVVSLLQVVKNINAGHIEDDIPPLRGGSRESLRVYTSFAKLYKIIRVSNVAFFSGNLAWAYGFISDALALFRKAGDSKAIGIACNNLGNTLHAMLRQAHGDMESCCNMVEGICCVAEAAKFYDRSIAMAEREFQGCASAEDRVEFGQQLSDRVFNRGLFYLLVSDSSCAGEDSRKHGLADIKWAQDIDLQVKEILVEDDKLLRKYSVGYFLRLIRRILGLVDYHGNEEVQAVWDVQGLITEADQFLSSFSNDPSAPLFDEMSPVGRLQQLESAAIMLDLCQGKTQVGAKLAIRMFSEDEYMTETAFVMAAKCLMKVVRDSAGRGHTKVAFRSDLRSMLNMCKQASLDLGKSLLFAVEIHEDKVDRDLLDRVNEGCLRLYDECCLLDDYMGVVASTTKEEGVIQIGLGLKEHNQGLQRAGLDIATSTTTTTNQSFSSLPIALQMLVDSDSSLASDSFLLLITDGFGWDFDAMLAARTTIRRLNRERDVKIHVIIFDVGIKTEEEVSVLADCKQFASLSKLSKYVALNATNVDTEFSALNPTIGGCRLSGSTTDHGLTMERF